MALREVLFSVFHGECGEQIGVVLAAFTLNESAVLIVQKAAQLEVWSPLHIIGKNYTFRNRSQGGRRQPLEMLLMSWIQSSPGDLCLLPEFVDTTTVPLALPSREEFISVWKKNKHLPTSEELCELMNIWMLQTYSFLPFVSSEVSVITSQSFVNLREHIKQLCIRCIGCVTSTTTLCAHDTCISKQHNMCMSHLMTYIQEQISLLRGAQAIQPTYHPQYLLCPWCMAVIDIPTLLFQFEDAKFVSLVIELSSLLKN